MAPVGGACRWRLLVALLDEQSPLICNYRIGWRGEEEIAEVDVEAED